MRLWCIKGAVNRCQRCQESRQMAWQMVEESFCSARTGQAQVILWRMYNIMMYSSASPDEIMTPEILWNYGHRKKKKKQDFFLALFYIIFSMRQVWDLISKIALVLYKGYFQQSSESCATWIFCRVKDSKDPRRSSKKGQKRFYSVTAKFRSKTFQRNRKILI